jgi:hypothetical protein
MDPIHDFPVYIRYSDNLLYDSRNMAMIAVAVNQKTQGKSEPQITAHFILTVGNPSFFQSRIPQNCTAL